MKISCRCGATIHDGTDALPHKAHVITDRDWFPFWDDVDAALERGGPAEAAAMDLRQKARSRRMWECTGFGRLWVESSDGALLDDLPGSGRANAPFAQ